MKKLLRLLVCLLVLVMAFSFAACGNDVAETPSETPPAEETPEEPAKITTYLDKNAATTYAEIEEYISNYTNYTFNNVMVSEMNMTNQGYSMYLGSISSTLKYAYTENEYWGLEKQNVVEDPMGMIEGIIPDGANCQITCADGVVYMSMEGYRELFGPLYEDFFVKDSGTFEDLKNATNVKFDVKDVPLYGPSETALADGYFELSDDGAVLIAVISGEEAEAYHEKNLSSLYDAELEYGDITYKVYLDEEGNMQKIEYSYDYSGELSGGFSAQFSVVGTITITDVNSTVITAPADASSYTEMDFIQ